MRAGAACANGNEASRDPLATCRASGAQHPQKSLRNAQAPIHAVS
jgi:hypothetical protein